MAIPFFDPKRAEAPLHAAMVAAATRVLHSGHYILGVEVEAFEEALADYVGVRYAVGVSSGSDALLMCLMALEVGPEHEVILPAYSFFATAGCALRLGARLRFVDIQAQGFCWDETQAATAQCERTACSIPVHLFGAPATIPKAGNAAVIEDAAQHLVPAPLDNLARCLSFFPSKNLGGCGDGGAILTNDEGFAAVLRQLRSHGSCRKYHHERVGGNFRLDAMQAALLRVKLPHLDAWLTARRDNAARYHSAYEALGLHNHGVQMPQTHPEHSYNQFVLRTPHRDALRNYLQQRGIATAVYYPSTLPAQPCIQSRDRSTHCPRAEQATQDSLALPIFVGLQAEEQQTVITAIADFFRRPPA